MAESEEELKTLLMKVKEESEKFGLKLNIQKMKIMASGPITSWEIDGETLETVSDFILGGSEITADGDCSHKIKRCFLLGRKVMTNLDSVFKSKDITLPTKVCLVKAKVFPVVMYGCESWAVKKAECWRIDAFELCLEETLQSPLDCKELQPVHSKGDQSWVFFGRSDVEAETPLATSLWRVDSLEKTLILGGIGGRRRRGWGWDGWMASRTRWTWVWVNSGSWWWSRRPGVLWFVGSQRVRPGVATELNWTDPCFFTVLS